ncbi:hypothetical protein A1O3_01999 [Capronia epimyces CBS 606.96]|uniref:Uncharacterized protein n=1 Tax=Capronia epimyces CBS 606.96 TaxID=1182542 RepID=W9YH12_9EURO|nr:uncharacterized protein A1O3_01999 [Capronia epimyces CBS 606.96]EXJ88935.1 hypothetical protein A1O3_01999 [Capronia epimyces CBS 606.96]
METFRHLTTPLRKHDRGADTAMPAYVIGSRPTKPLSAMSIEELLDYLPDCSPSAVTQVWLPAVRAQFQKMIALLNDVGELKIESSLNQIAFQKVGLPFPQDTQQHIDRSQDLKSFSDEIRLIAASYHKVLESAESLVERDTKACHERLHELEDQVADALEKMGAKDEEIAEQDRTNIELRHTIHDIAHILGSFIHDNVSSWVQTINEPRTEEVLQIISDYTRHADNQTKSVPYIRVPESAITQYAEDVREAKAVSKEYRELVHSQSAMVNEHSRNLDTYTNKYEIAVRLIKERDHEILLLAQKIESMTKRLQECEAALVQSQESIEEVESKAGRYEELRGNMDSLKIAHTLEIAQRDDEISRLRQMLGSAREEVFARRADVKNIISQSQTGLSASDLAPATMKGGPASKALRFFGMDRDKERGRRAVLPSSQSMIGFASSHHDATTHPFDTRYSSKEVAPAKSRSLLRHDSPLGKRRHAETTPTTPADGSDSCSGSMASLQAAVRPRSDSLGATQRHGVLPSPINTQKALPDPPARSQPPLVSAARLAEITQSDDSPMAVQVASDYFQHSILGQTAARRVLSNIPEVSTYGSSDAGEAKDPELSYYEEGSDGSVASSDREVYRKSVCALDMLNSSTLPYSETETDVEAILRGVAGTESEGHYPNVHTFDEDHSDEFETGLARVLHLRPGNHDLRAVRERERDGDREERFRQSFVSDGSGYRSEGSEPMTVAQLYHRGRRHIRG